MNGEILKLITSSLSGTWINPGIIGHMDVKCIKSCSNRGALAVEFSERHGRYSTRRLIIWKPSELEPDAESIYPLDRFETLQDKVEHVVGAGGTKCYYLDRSFRTCHVDLVMFNGGYYRHFFLHEEWPSLDWKMLFHVTSKGIFLVFIVLLFELLLVLIVLLVVFLVLLNSSSISKSIGIAILVLLVLLLDIDIS